MASAPQNERYVPAAGRAPLAFYDPVVALVMRERTFRGRLQEQVLADGPEIVADVGCGTGTFALALARAGRGVSVVGVDGDPSALARARAKESSGEVGRRAGRAVDTSGPVDERAGWAEDASRAVDWRAGRAEALPLDDASVDRVVLSLLLHHLSPATQLDALREARRVLRRGGHVHVADWGPPRDPAMRLAFRGLQLLDGVENTTPLGAGRLPGMLTEAGFADVRLHDRLRTGGGVLELRSAVRA